MGYKINNSYHGISWDCFPFWRSTMAIHPQVPVGIAIVDSPLRWLIAGRAPVSNHDFQSNDGLGSKHVWTVPSHIASDLARGRQPYSTGTATVFLQSEGIVIRHGQTLDRYHLYRRMIHIGRWSSPYVGNYRHIK